MHSTGSNVQKSLIAFNELNTMDSSIHKSGKPAMNGTMARSLASPGQEGMSDDGTVVQGMQSLQAL